MIGHSKYTAITCLFEAVRIIFYRAKIHGHPVQQTWQWSGSVGSVVSHGWRCLGQWDWNVGGCGGVSFLRGFAWVARPAGCSIFQNGGSSDPCLLVTALCTACTPFHEIATIHTRSPTRRTPILRYRFFLLAQHFPSIKILTLENDFHEEIFSCRRRG